jgi:acyl-CoA dehydrogenase
MSILLPFLLLLLVAAFAAYHRFSLAVFAALSGTMLVACALGGVSRTGVIAAAVLLAIFVLPLLVTPIRQALVTRFLLGI